MDIKLLLVSMFTDDTHTNDGGDTKKWKLEVYFQTHLRPGNRLSSGNTEVGNKFITTDCGNRVTPSFFGFQFFYISETMGFVKLVPLICVVLLIHSPRNGKKLEI